MKRTICEKITKNFDAPTHGNHCHLLNGSSIPTFVIDNNHTVQFWNSACEHITGTAASEVVGTNHHWAVFYPQPRPIMADLIVSCASDEEFDRYYGASWSRSSIIDGAVESENFYPGFGEQGIWLFFSASPLKDADGNVVGAIETLQDISERKRAEAALLEHRENLSELVRQRTKELERANEELSQYAFAVSHDLRAPLRAIRNYAGYLREDLDAVLTGEQRSYLDGMGHALRHGDALVKDILDFSRIGSGAMHLQPVALDDFFSDLVREMQKEHRDSIFVARNMPVVIGDRTIMTQIFSNLIANGLKFNRTESRRVDIEARPLVDGNCEIAIRDNGIGIDPRYHDRIFKMFKRLHTHKEFEGTGIGLAIVHKAVLQSNGSIRIASNKGAGSTFYVTLPLAGDDRYAGPQGTPGR